MAFASVIQGKRISGDRVETWGTFASSGGSTGGDIDVGMGIVENITLTQKGAAVTTGAPVVNETFPMVGTAGASAKPTIVTDANVEGTWRAQGKGY